MPIYGPGKPFEGQTFHQTFLDTIEPFEVLWFMDWGKTNSNFVENWESRIPDDFNQYSGPAGVPVEEVVRLENTAGSAPWFNTLS